MDIKIIASGSTGNCYRVSDGETSILIECGLSIKKLKIGLGFSLNELQGCLVTHEHKDHSRAILDVAKAGLDVYASMGTVKACEIGENHRIHIVKALEQFYVGSWTILPFPTQHDATEPLGFLLYSEFTGEKLLFATDTYYVGYKFKDLTHIMLECNYDIDDLDANILNGLVSPAQRKRLIKSHFEISNVIAFLQANDLSKVRAIYLIHLSTTNGNAEKFKKLIMSKTGIPVFAANKNGGVI